MRPLLIVFFLIAFPLKAEVLSVHCPLGCPTNSTANDLIFNHVNTLFNNSTTKFADWVVCEVDVLNFGDSAGRNWKVDPLLDDEETLEKDDYDDLSLKLTNADEPLECLLETISHVQLKINFTLPSLTNSNAIANKLGC